jgi:hypothetical protein
MLSMEPIRHTVTVAASPEMAFELFADLGSWWDPEFTPDPATFSGVSIHPRVGSPVLLMHGAKGYKIGEVTGWEPAARYAQTFTLAMDPEHPTTIEARFAWNDEEDGCILEFEHGGWTADNVGVRDKYTAWPHLLGRYVGYVEE